MEYLKFILVLIFELVRTNIVKTILLTTSIVCFNLAGNFPDTIDTYKIIGETKVEQTNVYFYKTISDNKIEYETITSEEPIKIVNGEIKISSYSGFNILFWILFSISTLILVIATFINDNDIGWELEDAWKQAFGTLIYCEEENGEYYYFALGRLIDKKSQQVSRRYTITSELRIDGFRELYRCPKYQTKTQRRETLLNKIGIK